MKRILLICFVLMSALISEAWAQRTVTGKVTGEAGGEGLPGVTVRAKGTTTGVNTDFDGNYRLNVPEGSNTLVFTFVGFVTVEEQIGNRSVIDVVMTEDVKQLEEVIVTANAIEREKRQLGYAVSTVGGEELTTARDANVLNSLAGKVPGVRISSQSGSIGASSRILIRGANSFGGDNQPLFVVDGVPISNSGSNNDISGGVDVGNRAADINPDDVASMTVLKGAAAAALYGSRAKDGAIIITTKKGNRKGATNVSVNSSLRFDNPLRLPDFQNEYAQGSGGKYNSESLNGWGPRVDPNLPGQFVEAWHGDSVQLAIHENNVEDFYQTGSTMMNSVSFAGGNEESDFRLGFTNTQQDGIIPGSELGRNSLSINAGTKMPNKISARVGLNYARTTSAGRAAQGSNNSTILTSIVNSFPRTFDLNEVKDYIAEDGTQRALSDFTNNPYWVINENPFTNEVDRMYGFAQATYDPTDWLNFTGRFGSDFYTETRTRIYRKGTKGFADGQFETSERFSRQVNVDLMATVQKDISESLEFTGLLGYNVNQRSFRRLGNTSQVLTVDELYTTTNAEVNSPTNYRDLRRLYGVYTDIGLGYKNFLFLNVTGRNDWSSTLPKENNSYFYPSASASFIFTQGLNISSDILSYGKIRANVAQVGSDEDPYQLNFAYTPASTAFVQYQSGNTYPISSPNGNLLAFSGPGTIPPSNLLPQRQNSWEIGTELQFFNGRVGLDATYYNTVTTDQILSIPIPESTGFAFKRINIGEISNKGIELLLTASPLSNPSGFNWNIALNYAANRQEVVTLAEGVDELIIRSGFSGVQVKAVPGEPFGLYGTGWARDSVSNELIIDGETGLRTPGENIRLGNIYPDFTLGMQNTFSYKGFNLSALVDYRDGGVIYSGTVQGVRFDGLAEETLVNREGTFIDKGVVANGDGTFRENDVPVEDMQTFWQNYSQNSVAESSTFDASFVKVREIRFGYTFSKGLLNRTPFGNAELAVEGRNLFILYSQVPHIDPEANLFGAGSSGEGYELNNIPSTRSVGFNLRLTF